MIKFGCKKIFNNTHNVLLSLSILVGPSDAFAEFHGTVAVTSNYVWRGISKSDSKFSYQANLDYEFDSGLYLGASAAKVDFADQGFKERAQFEIIPYIGWTISFTEEWRLDVQYSRYFYDGKIFGLNSDYNEFYAFLHYSDLFSLRTSFSENYYDRGHTSGDFEFTARYPITDWLQVSSGIGYSLTEEAIEYDYLYWNAGMSIFYKNFLLDLRYADANEIPPHISDELHYEEYTPELSETLYFSISVGF